DASLNGATRSSATATLHWVNECNWRLSAVRICVTLQVEFNRLVHEIYVQETRMDMSFVNC
ncbi:MAG: hypothetical protein JWR44_3789, partial [Hymenobacter sp.]|nr:hypothetical protein [Hymenobacter sp.]